MTVNIPSINAVLKLINSRKRPVSISQIIARTGLSLRTARLAVNTLQAQKLIRLRGQINTGVRGRPALTYGVA